MCAKCFTTTNSTKLTTTTEILLWNFTEERWKKTKTKQTKKQKTKKNYRGTMKFNLNCHLEEAPGVQGVRWDAIVYVGEQIYSR